MKTHRQSRLLSDNAIPRVCALMFGLSAALVSQHAEAVVPLPDVPLFVISGGKPNVLMILDNSNSMDESAAGVAVGSDSPNSKSQIARNVIKDLVSTYTGRINMGLMSYQQAEPAAWFLHSAAYDASYDPGNYDPTFTGARDSITKRFRVANPTDPGKYIYYNVALPFYSSRNEGSLYCGSATANFDNGAETFPAGPWDTYQCYNSKTGPSDNLPVNAAAAASAGYSGFRGNFTFSPTDSDLAQNILDFGKLNPSFYVSRAWFSNTSPGKGFLHVPVKDLDAIQAAAINAKLDCNIPEAPLPCTGTGLKNAGLTPIEGTLLTAKDYFANALTAANQGFTATTYPLPQTCKKNFAILVTDGLPSTDKNGAALSNPAAAITAAAAAAAALYADGTETYVVGFALPFGTDPTTLDVIAAAGGSGTALNANDPVSLNAALSAIFQDIEAQSASGSAVAANSTSLTTDTRLFSAAFKPGGWSGSLDAHSITGRVIDPTPLWTASIPVAASRVILTLDGGNDANFPTAAQLATLGAGPAAYIAGDRTGEGTTYRARTTLLGDIVDSSPVFVRDPAPVPANSTLNDMVYVGANDGMLHGFNANTGVERFAYVPASLNFAVLKTLSSPSYAHKFFVDGSIAVSDNIQTPGRRILVGLLGRGGRAVYAIDVTDPAAPDILWEKTSGAVGFGNLGFALGNPVIAKLNNGSIGVLIGNGYNGANEQSSVLVLDLLTGSLITELVTGSGSPIVSNGMASPVGWDADANGTVDFIYAGDLLGNLWKFDVGGHSANTWKSALGTNANPRPFFVAKDSAGKLQPITGGPTVGLDPDTFKRWVFFGTGRYLTLTDPAVADIQSWYGLIDEGSVAVAGRLELKARNIVLVTTGFGKVLRSFEVAAANDLVGKKGWFIDLTTPGVGERMVSGNFIIGRNLFASSIIPKTGVSCLAGGGGFINALDAYTGATVRETIFDINEDGLFNGLDNISDPNDPDNNLLEVGSVALFGDEMPSGPIVIGDVLVAGGSGAGLGSIGINISALTGRISWREVIRD